MELVMFLKPRGSDEIPSSFGHLDGIELMV